MVAGFTTPATLLTAAPHVYPDVIPLSGSLARDMQ